MRLTTRLEGWGAALAELAGEIFGARQRLSLRGWAEEVRRWPDRTPYRVDLTPHIGEILDAYSDPGVEEITVMKPSQSGLTEGVFLNAIGYHMDHDPRGLMVVIPSLEEAQKWSRAKLQPMIDATPRLQGLLDDRSRRATNSVLEKTFPGGRLGITGSNSGRGFRMVTVGTVLGDDVDGWDATAGKGKKNEGDQVTLIRRRTDRIPDRKLVWGSTPTMVGHRIHSLYRRMERRGRFHVPCPHCGAMQVLRWGGADTAYGIKWEREEIPEGRDYVVKPGEVLRGRTVHRPETAWYACAVTGCVIEAAHKPAMEAAGRYLTDEGEPVRVRGARKIGFWFNGLTLTLPGAEWPRLVREFLEIAGDPDALRGFWNTVLAEPWEDRRDKVDASQLAGRKQRYAAEVPDGVGLLTGFVDVHSNRLELQVQGWGIREESWILRHVRIMGDPEQDDVWEWLEGIRTREWVHESGARLRIYAMGIDEGYLQKRVYRYVRGKEGDRVYAFDGVGGKRQKTQVRLKKPNREGVRPYRNAVDVFKDIIFRRLRIQQPGPGYLHFVAPSEAADVHEGEISIEHGMDAEYFTQITDGEVIRWKRAGGMLVREYHQVRANEGLDLLVGNLAALHTVPGVREQLPRLVAEARKGSGARPVRPARSNRPRVLNRGIS